MFNDENTDIYVTINICFKSHKIILRVFFFFYREKYAVFYIIYYIYISSVVSSESIAI